MREHDQGGDRAQIVKLESEIDGSVRAQKIAQRAKRLADVREVNLAKENAVLET